LDEETSAYYIYNNVTLYGSKNQGFHFLKFFNSVIIIFLYHASLGGPE